MDLKLIHGKCVDELQDIDPVRCIFTDPPDNIDLAYGEYKDKMPDADYVALVGSWLDLFLHKASTVWLSFNARWTADVGELACILRRRYAVTVKPCVQVFTFGQHNPHDFGNNHRPLWRFQAQGAPIYADQIRVESWRQRNGDKRANPAGRVPGDVFDMQYPDGTPCAIGKWLSAALDDPNACPEFKADIERWFQTQHGDVFDFPRVTGNSKQRCDWHPTQLNEELVKRAILSSTLPGDMVLDPFAGTGTTMRVCEEVGRQCTLVEMDIDYCLRVADEQNLEPIAKGVWHRTYR